VKPRCVGIIGSGFDGDMGLAMMAVLGLISHSKPRAPRHLTPEEIAAHDKRTERERWNAAVDERRRAKQAAKKGYTK
jgi:hypothetical protein